ncbi:hypothetical protein EDC01DRAFT_630532 [Geopyxis carbonaria]|nr:hypothetical protein EDC01DRAFT_630532 [Geopyxis carbonaria]
MTRTTSVAMAPDEAVVTFFNHCRTNSLSYQSALTDMLHNHSPKEQLEMITNILLTVPEMDEAITEITSIAYECVMEAELWKLQYPSLGEFHQLIDYDATIQPLIQRNAINHAKKQKILENIEALWGCSLDTVISIDIMPPTPGEHLLRDNLKMARSCPEPSIAKRIFEESYLRRMNSQVNRKPGSKRKVLTRADVKNAIHSQRETAGVSSELEPSSECICGPQSASSEYCSSQIICIFEANEILVGNSKNQDLQRFVESQPTTPNLEQTNVSPTIESCSISGNDHQASLDNNEQMDWEPGK